MYEETKLASAIGHTTAERPSSELDRELARLEEEAMSVASLCDSLASYFSPVLGPRHEQDIAGELSTPLASPLAQRIAKIRSTMLGARFSVQDVISRNSL